MFGKCQKKKNNKCGIKSTIKNYSQIYDPTNYSTNKCYPITSLTLMPIWQQSKF